MLPDDLRYVNLTNMIAPLAIKGKTESVTFLNWFLENIYRLDSVSADDAICDSQNDKGIDAIYVDENNEEIHFFQCKIRQKDNGTIGDVSPKTFMASVAQFDTSEKVAAILAGNADNGLKKLIERLALSDLLQKGYKPIGVFVSNESNDDAARAYAAIEPQLRIFDRHVIANNFIDSDQGVGVLGSFEFDVSYVAPLEMTIGTDNTAKVYVFPARALELVALGGISDTSLFTKNVRYDLGNTPVNKSIRRSIETKDEHRNFSLFHNGVIILCDTAELKGDILKVSNYSVVNGAQSITTFFSSKGKLTDDLRVLVRIIALQNDALARKITEYSNNQNAIKPRDLRSNHAVMTRLQSEMNQQSTEFFFEIKRGEVAPASKTIISNEALGRAMLAMDILEPWSCHQIYKVFDDKYADIFGRKEVNATRAIFIMRLMWLIESNLDSIEVKPLAHYALTKYFLAFLLSKILRKNETTQQFMRDPSTLPKERETEFLTKCGAIISTLIIDLNYEVKQKGSAFDYKAEFKSPKQVEEWQSLLIRSYEKDVARKKAESFAEW